MVSMKRRSILSPEIFITLMTNFQEEHPTFTPKWKDHRKISSKYNEKFGFLL